MTDYTDQERQTLRTAAFGAMYLVSSADPGFFASFKESIAGAKALANTSTELRDVLKTGGLPELPKGSSGEMESGVLSALQQSASILQSKNPQELAEFRNVISAACDQVANASGGVKETETAAIAKVKAAIGA
ncbi:hypothetical protein QEZ54_15635 [Catellatospora sp. KI3]|uniref:hypothetical protein n=1 Tax=Catellatospora sp. KI3 TaxID=3041620 RepID=UPI0024831277|nr:hypothetical protein [Catellatospora sp. KI3]MDI1462402.1 hypothetical protein [Catellatospora sp. KI3]